MGILLSPDMPSERLILATLPLTLPLLPPFENKVGAEASVFSEEKVDNIGDDPK